MDDLLTLLEGDAVDRLRTLETGSVHCVVTSPPYWGLRDYGTASWEGGEAGCDHKEATARHDGGRENVNGFHGSARADSDKGAMNYRHECGKCGAKRIDSQLGLERTPEEYVAKMVEVFRDVRRVLRKDGTLWLNLGDSYASDTKGQNNNGEGGSTLTSGARPHVRAAYNDGRGREGHRVEHGLKPKDLCGIPWRVAFALQADGWWLRSDIIWAKPNPMPESVTDRPTKSHEYLFLLTKSASYFYDSQAILEQSSYGEQHANKATSWGPNGKMAQHGIGKSNRENYLFTGDNHTSRKFEDGSYGRNKRSVWTVATAPYPEAHFATYPPDLIKPCIMAGTSAKGCCAKCGAPWERIVEHVSGRHNPQASEYQQTKSLGVQTGGTRQTTLGGEAGSNKTLGWQPTCKCDAAVAPCVCLDPFAGSGTTGAVTIELGRKAILIELNPAYVKLIQERCDITPGLALA